MTIKEEIIDFLETLANTGKPTLVTCGICANLEKFLDRRVLEDDDCEYWPSKLMEKYAIRWEKFSGDDTYPIPATSKKALSSSECRESQAAYQYDVIKTSLWKGRQLALRKELCRFIAQQLREEVN